MADAGDGDRVFAGLLEKDAVVPTAEAEADLGRLKLLDVAIACGEIAVYAVENLEGGRAVDGSEVALSVQ